MPRSINMIRPMFQDATILMNIINQVTNPFNLHKGIQRGCPLAAYLLIIFM